MEALIGRFIFKCLYKSKSVERNQEQFSKGVLELTNLVKSYEESTLTGRKKIAPLPGITEVMRDWSPYMTIHHLNLVHREIMAMIYDLEAGKTVAIGDLSRFDHFEPQGHEVMEVFHQLAQEVTDLPQHLEFCSSNSVEHPFFGTLTAKGYYAVLAMHLKLHVNQIKKSAKLNLAS